MKPFFNKLIIAFIVVGGLFIGAVKGQEARSKWVNKMKNKDEDRPRQGFSETDEVLLDDYEMASFHNN